MGFLANAEKNILIRPLLQLIFFASLARGIGKHLLGEEKGGGRGKDCTRLRVLYTGREWGDLEPVRSPRPWDTSIFGVVFPVETLKNITSRFSEGEREG